MKKTVLITGAATGIGRAIAHLFAKNGFNVIVNYNKSEDEALTLKHELNSIHCSNLLIKADVSNYDDVKFMVEKAINAFKNIDVLINNAAISQQKLFTDISCEEWLQMFDVNVNGPFYLCKEVLPGMIRRKQGKIINISSIWGITGASCEVHYSSSKAAIIGLTKALAKEVGPSNINVNCICPGVINTKINKNIDIDTLNQLKTDTPLCRIGSPNDIAKLALFLAGDESNFITGEVIKVDGGFII